LKYPQGDVVRGEQGVNYDFDRALVPSGAEGERLRKCALQQRRVRLGHLLARHERVHDAATFVRCPAIRALLPKQAGKILRRSK
jgi:hypothetical protein